MDKVTSETLSTLLHQKDLQQIPPDVLKKIESHFETATKNIQKHHIELKQKDEEITKLTDKLKEVTDNIEKALEKMFPRASAANPSLKNSMSITDIYKRYYDAESRRLELGEPNGEDQKILEIEHKLQNEYKDLNVKFYEYRMKATKDYSLLKKQHDAKQSKVDELYSVIAEQFKSRHKDMDLLKSNIQALETLYNICRERLKSSELEHENTKKMLNEMRLEYDKNMEKNKNHEISDNNGTNNEDYNKLSSIPVRNCASPNGFKGFDGSVSHTGMYTLKRRKDATSVSAGKISPQNKRLRNNTNDGINNETGIGKSINLECSDEDTILDENEDVCERIQKFISRIETSFQAHGFESKLTVPERSPDNDASEVGDNDSLERCGSDSLQIRAGLAIKGQTQRNADEEVKEFKEFSSQDVIESTPIAGVGREVGSDSGRGRPGSGGNARGRPNKFKKWKNKMN